MACTAKELLSRRRELAKELDPLRELSEWDPQGLGKAHWDKEWAKYLPGHIALLGEVIDALSQGDVSVAEVICRTRCVVPRCREPGLMLCAAALYGTQEVGLEPLWPFIQSQKQALEDEGEALAPLVKLAQLRPLTEEEAGIERGYQALLAQTRQTLGSFVPLDGQGLIQTLQEKTERFFATHTDLGTQGAVRDYIDLAHPVVRALRTGNVELARYILTGMAPQRDPFWAMEDMWIKAGAAALWGAAGEPRHPAQRRRMQALVDYFIVYGGCDYWNGGFSGGHRGDVPWRPVPHKWVIDEGYPVEEGWELTQEWEEMVRFNTATRLGFGLEMDKGSRCLKLEDAWWKEDKSLGVIWLEEWAEGRGDTWVEDWKEEWLGQKEGEDQQQEQQELSARLAQLPRAYPRQAFVGKKPEKKAQGGDKA